MDAKSGKTSIVAKVGRALYPVDCDRLIDDHDGDITLRTSIKNGFIQDLLKFVLRD